MALVYMLLSGVQHCKEASVLHLCLHAPELVSTHACIPLFHVMVAKQAGHASLSMPSQALPPSVANASREDLQRMLMDSLRKTKARDKKLVEVTAERDALAAKQGSGAAPSENGASEEHLQQQMQVQSHGSYLFLGGPWDVVQAHQRAAILGILGSMNAILHAGALAFHLESPGTESSTCESAHVSICHC